MQVEEIILSNHTEPFLEIKSAPDSGAPKAPWNYSSELRRACSRWFGRVEKSRVIQEICIDCCALGECSRMDVASWRGLIISGSCRSSSNTVVGIIPIRKTSASWLRLMHGYLRSFIENKGLPQVHGYKPRLHNLGLLATNLLCRPFFLQLLTISNKRFLNTGPVLTPCTLSMVPSSCCTRKY